MKTSRIILNIESVVCFIFGALYTFSLVFIPLGVYCFIAGRRFSYKAEHMYDTMFLSDKDFKSYVIFVSIVCFPLGLLSVIPYLKITSNNVSVTDTNGLHLQEDSVQEAVAVTDVKGEKKEESESNAEVVEVQKNEELSEEEKQEKFKKLQNFRDKGIITEEELELAREQLFGKK